MIFFEDLPPQSNNKMSKTIQQKKFIIPVLGIGLVVGTIIIFALSVTTLIKVNSKFDEIVDNEKRQMSSSKVFQQSSNSTLAASIRIEEVMSYLNELQRIATASNGTRAINTPGFNATLDFISNYLTANTNYKLTKSSFSAIITNLARQPILISSINGTKTNHTYSRNASMTDFYEMSFTTSTNFTDYVELTVIPNVGCSDDDWDNATPSPAGRAVLVKRGECSFAEKSTLASKYNAVALLVYNDGTAPDRIFAIGATLNENNTLPALFLSFPLGQTLADAAKRTAGDVGISMNIIRLYQSPVTSANICADTPTGDPTKTIVIGSHTDGVPAGPGINDNGSGSAANLALAVALARLFRTSTYPKYKYRVRFCWWGAEEVGLLGSKYHVEQAKNSTIVGERLSDYLINLNYDMLGSPNYIFGIYDGHTANNDTPLEALPGSNKMTTLYKDWFVEQNLPWDYTDFSGRSDYGPFLAEGIVAGGLFSGGDDIKPQEQRDRYDQMLGQGMGGVSGINHDPCYHQACDSIQNINVFAYERMVQAAAYALEYLSRQDDLKAWLYPSADIQRLNIRSRQQSSAENNSIKANFKSAHFCRQKFCKMCAKI